MSDRRPPMTVKEAAKYLGGIKPAKVRELVRRKLLKCSKALPGKWLIDRNSVETFMERTC